MKASELFVDMLEKKWVHTIYWVPKEENLDLVYSIRKSGKIKLVITRNEQMPVFMAATYRRLTGNVGLALTTMGTGLDLGNPDFVKLAESLWGKGYKVQNKHEFKSILEQANQ